MSAQDLLAYARTALLSPDEVTLALCQSALKEAQAMDPKGKLNETQLLDLAFFRLVLRLKMDVPESLLFLVKEIQEFLKQVNTATKYKIGEIEL